MRLMHHMPPAVIEKHGPTISADVDFDLSVQTLDALEAAAYRLIGTATCQIERVGGRFVCHLVTQDRHSTGAVKDSHELKTYFLNLVTDENLRARLAQKTEGMRNVILALAFGSLAADREINS
jgi:His-Xaa-Ser system protein HxsD